jgi:ribosomal-protein-alanine N-acetyltransferase
LAAVHRTSGELIGSADIAVASCEHKRGQFGFVLHRDFWSQGYTTGAAKLLASRACNCESSAQRAIRITTPQPGVLQKAGLEYEGRIRSHLFVRRGWRDSLLYAVVNGDG